MFAFVGAIFFVATLLMQRMVPLRVANMVGCTFFVFFGALFRKYRYLSALPAAVAGQRRSPPSTAQAR
ncbi:MAG TPA: hypothetical protein VKY22_10555 [Bradyrhizobium sp.]|nr:hypothetical protein [Bradyrhizobium sp.]